MFVTLCCEDPDCEGNVSASFGFPDVSGVRFCVKHMLPGMINKKHEHCNGMRGDLECKALALYNYPGQTRGLFCRECRDDGMVNVVNRLCGGCRDKQPAFNFPGESVALFCWTCAAFGMVNVKQRMCVECGDVSAHSNPAFKKHCQVCFFQKFPGGAADAIPQVQGELRR